jgi:hypothetical protein
MIAIVPDSLRHAIDMKLDAAILACPQAGKERESLFLKLLNYYDEHGVVPDFVLTPKGPE